MRPSTKRLTFRHPGFYSVLFSYLMVGCIHSASHSDSSSDQILCGAARDVRCDGAVGDGQTDNTAAFAKTYASGASTIYIPAGNWRGHWPRITRAILFHGDGNVSTSFTGDSSGLPIFDVSSQGYAIRDLGFWGNPNLSIKLESGAHFGALSNLLCRSSPATFIYDYDAWDMEWDDLEMVSCGGQGSPAEGGSIVLDSTNNITLVKPTIEGAPDCGIVAANSSQIYVIGGKVDNGFVITAKNGEMYVDGSSITLKDFSFQGSYGYELVLMGQYSFDGSQIYFGGGAGTPNIYMAPTWQQYINSNPQPYTGSFSCIQCQFFNSHPSVPTVNPANFEVVTPSIVRTRAGMISAFGATNSGAVETSLVAITGTVSANNIYDRNYLVEADSGDSVRAKIDTSFAGGLLALFGSYSSPDFGPGASNLHFIEWDANPYPHISLEQAQLEGADPIFLPEATVTTSNSPASFSSATGYTTIHTDYTGSDLTNYWIVDPVTTRPFHIESHDTATGDIVVSYNQTSYFRSGASYMVYAGALFSTQMQGSMVTWSADGTFRSLPVATLQLSGRSTSEVFPWGEGSTTSAATTP
jgi:hypothetical protein